MAPSFEQHLLDLVLLHLLHLLPDPLSRRPTLRALVHDSLKQRSLWMQDTVVVDLTLTVLVAQARLQCLVAIYVFISTTDGFESALKRFPVKLRSHSTIVYKRRLETTLVVCVCQIE